MQKWEYKVIDLASEGMAEVGMAESEGGTPGSILDTCDAVMNRYGSDGWMLADITIFPATQTAPAFLMACLMRPVAEPEG